MASANFSAVLPASAHPMANSGYGKRTAPDELPRGTDDFAHLGTREAEVGAYVDRLPDGAAIGYKALAANLPAYGQQACAKALNHLSLSGHLRLIKEHLQVEDNTFRWVTHTYWSRTARDDAWWKAFVAGLHGIDVTDEVRKARRALEEALARPSVPGAEPALAVPESGRELTTESAAQPAPAPAPAAPQPPPSDAYRILSRLGRTEPRMTLSAAECSALEALAAQWLARGATPDHLVRALTDGLPHPLHSPGALARNRLEKKMPPEPTQTPSHITRALMICFGCEVPENVKPLRGGLCADCHAEMMEDDDDPEAPGIIPGRIPDIFRNVPHQVDVARRAAEARAAAGFTPRPGS